MAAPPAPRLPAMIALELRAARLEGLLAADPELAGAWRAAAALTEACRSTALEDVRVSEADVVARPFGGGISESEGSRGVEAALALLPVLARPGDLLGATAETLARCLAAGGRRADPPPDLATRMRRDLDGAAPLLGALRAAARLRLETEGAAPAAERLIFVAADHALRGGRASDERRDDGRDAMEVAAGIEASWILSPGAALSDGLFRAWSPTTPRGIDDLLAGLAVQVDRGLGAVAALRAWRDRAEEVAKGRGGRSRFDDFRRFMMERPVFTVRDAAAAIQATERTALNLVDLAVERRLATCITGRRSWRAWAISPIAERLRRERPHGRPIRSSRTFPVDGREEPVSAWRDARNDGDGAGGDAAEARLAEIFAELDRAKAAVSEVMAPRA